MRCGMRAGLPVGRARRVYEGQGYSTWIRAVHPKDAPRMLPPHQTDTADTKSSPPTIADLNGTVVSIDFHRFSAPAWEAGAHTVATVLRWFQRFHKFHTVLLLCKRVRSFQTLPPLLCVFNVSNNIGESASRSK